MSNLTIKQAYDDLMNQLDCLMMDLDLLYEFESCGSELSTKNQQLYENMSNAIASWALSLEDQLIVESRGEFSMYYEDEEIYIDGKKEIY